MHPRSSLILFAVAAAACAQPPPDSSEKARMLDGIREAVVAYTQKLPNFICTQVTVRDAAAAPDSLLGVNEAGRGVARFRPPGGEWQRVDSLEQQLSYFEGHESYKLLKVNGKLPDAKKPALTGATSNGEFGTTLSKIFEPDTGTVFEWKRWETVRGRPVSVFAIKVEKSRSTAELVTPVARAVVGYHGFLFADRENHTVLRLITVAEAPPDFPLQETTHTLEYGSVAIAGDQFVLPIHDEMLSRSSLDFVQSGKLGGNSRQVLIRNRTDFRGYRRYTVDAVLKDDPDPK